MSTIKYITTLYHGGTWSVIRLKEYVKLILKNGHILKKQLIITITKKVML